MGLLKLTLFQFLAFLNQPFMLFPKLFFSCMLASILANICNFMFAKTVFMCVVSVSAPPAENHNPNKKGMNVAVIILLSILGSTILILGMLGAYKYWQKRKREQDQARFLKLFEEGDDIEDELGLGTII